MLGLDDNPVGEHYKIFFSKIFKLESARILLCPIQLSEILNRLLRFYANKAYDKKYLPMSGAKPSRNVFYKDEYRGSEDFQIHYQSTIDDIQSFLSHVLIADISNKEFDNLTSFHAKNLDFNDHYLYLLAKEQSAIIVTHDADFFELDVVVGTFNLKLYKNYTNSIKPNS